MFCFRQADPRIKSALPDGEVGSAALPHYPRWLAVHGSGPQLEISLAVPRIGVVPGLQLRRVIIAAMSGFQMQGNSQSITCL